MTPHGEGGLSDDILDLDQIKFEKVGRVDSVMYNLDAFEIPLKVNLHALDHPTLSRHHGSILIS